MQPQILVVSDPPHGDVDPAAVADVLGLEVETARLKIAFPAPEVVGASDPHRAEELASALQSANLSVQVVDGQRLAELPWPEPAALVGVGPDGLVARVANHLVEVGPSKRLLAVSCQPPAELPRAASTDLDEAGSIGDPSRVADALEWTPHLDLLVEHAGERRRIALVDDVPATLARIESALPHADIDRRLDNVRPRQRFVAGEADFDPDMRKAFSFGTLLLRQVLESISPELRDIPQYEFASRLSYALRTSV